MIKCSGYPDLPRGRPGRAWVLGDQSELANRGLGVAES